MTCFSGRGNALRYVRRTDGQPSAPFFYFFFFIFYFFPVGDRRGRSQGNSSAEANQPHSAASHSVTSQWSGRGPESDQNKNNKFNDNTKVDFIAFGLPSVEQGGDAVGLLSVHFLPDRAAAVLVAMRATSASRWLACVRAEHRSHRGSPIILKIK
jgi:hypothetical protein